MHVIDYWKQLNENIFLNSVICSNTNSRTPLHQLSTWGGRLSFDKGLHLFELYQLLLNAGADEILIDNMELFNSYHGPVTDLKYLQRQAYPPYQDTPLQLRLAAATRQLEAVWHNVPLIFETLLDNGGEINVEMAKWTNKKGQTLLNLLWISYIKGETGKHFEHDLDTQDLETIKGLSNGRLFLYQRLSCKLISAGASLQSVDNEGYTLLTRMLEGLWASTLWKRKNVFKLVDALKEDWLFALLESGVDIHEYGAWESGSLQKKDFIVYMQHYGHNKDSEDDEDDEGDENSVRHRKHLEFVQSDIRLINFKYGPSPEDWIFWFSEPSDPFAGDFWAMIEGEEHWRIFEKGWFFDECHFEWSRGWYFDVKATSSDEEAASIDILPMPGAWEF